MKNLKSFQSIVVIAIWVIVLTACTPPATNPPPPSPTAHPTNTPVPPPTNTPLPTPTETPSPTPTITPTLTNTPEPTAVTLTVEQITTYDTETLLSYAPSEWQEIGLTRGSEIFSGYVSYVDAGGKIAGWYSLEKGEFFTGFLQYLRQN